LNALTKEIAEMLTPRAKELNIKLDCAFEEGLAKVPVDPEALHRALLNVVGNALDAVEGRPGPQVTIATRKDPEEGWVRIVVLDNGVGILPQQLHDLFKPFVSTKGARGTGLGLAVSRKILREHGGDIQVQSQPGKGSKFILRMPARGMGGEAKGADAVLQTQKPPLRPN
jgi:signal transduction histidine kinase